MVVISAWSMFCRPISLWNILILNNGFHMLYLALVESRITLVICLGGLNEPSV
jgi:hypothetical protein